MLFINLNIFYGVLLLLIIGNYVYLDASGGGVNSEAALQGPLLRKSSPTCQLTFWYVVTTITNKYSIFLLFC